MHYGQTISPTPRIAAIAPLTSTIGTAREAMSFCFVRVETDAGQIGYGEACDSYGCSYASVLETIVHDVYAPLVVGQPAWPVGPVIDRVRLATRRRLGDTWAAAQARSAVEIALWDAAGKAAGRSVSSMLGRVRERVEVYASSVFLEEGTARWHAELLAPLLERGVRKVKVRLGPQWQRDLATLGELAALLGPAVELMVDGSETFTLPTALEIADRLRALSVRWFEEPLPHGSRAGIEALARRSKVPIAYGEHLFGRDDTGEALRRGLLDVLQPDASTCGGISEARDVAASAAPFGVRVVPHVCAGPISLAANLHVAASVPAIHLIEYPPSLAGVWSTLGTGCELGPGSIADGTVAVPDGPGLGVGLDERAVDQHPYRPPGARAAGTTTGLLDRFAGDR